MIELSTRSLELLALTDFSSKQVFIEERKNLPIVITNYIVCMSLVRKEALETETSISQIVVGTETGFIYIIDQSGSKIIYKAKIPTIPYTIVTSGCFDIEYFLYIAGRDNIIHIIRNGELIDLRIDVPSKIFGMVKTSKSLVVGCNDSCIHAYSMQGTKLYSIKFPANLTCMEALEIRTYPIFSGFMVGLKNGEFRIYSERTLTFVYKFTESIFCMKSGNYGNLGKCFVFISESGAFIIKKLKSVNLEVSK